MESKNEINNNGFDYVDLCLPSGTLWATYNVGASRPSDYGLYFQWGDTKGYTKAQVGIVDGKKNFALDWSDYKWGSEPNFSNYTAAGETLKLEGKIIKKKGPIGIGEAIATVDGKVAAKGELTFAIV